jgi:tetratricopeptide (TPR) repeat protein
MRVLKEVRQYIENYQLKSGLFHFYRGEHGPAAEYLTRALREESLSAADRRSALYYLVQTRIGAANEHLDVGQVDRAIEEYQAALEVIPSYADVHARLARVLASTGDLQGAMQHYREAVEINPLFVSGWLGLGHAALRASVDDTTKAEDAREAFRRAREARETLASERMREAEAALEAGDFEAAEGFYKDAFREDHAMFRDHLDRGLLLLRHEKWEDAAEELSRARDISPRFADVHNYLGVALAEDGQLERGCVEFERSVAINPDYVVAWLNLAYARTALARSDAARSALEEVLRREPDNAPALRLNQRLGAGATTPSSSTEDG